MDWKATLGTDKDTFTIADIEAATADMKLADLGDGRYVDKQKHDRELRAATNKLTEAQTRIDELEKAANEKGDGSDESTRQIETLTAQVGELTKRLENESGARTKAERVALVASRLPHLSDKLKRIALQDAEARVDDDTDFAAALDALVAEDADYAPPADGSGNPPAPAKVDSGAPGKGTPAPDNLKAAIDAVFPE